MNVTEEAGKKLLILCKLSAIEWKKRFSKIYSTLLFCIKPSLKSTFVRSSNQQNKSLKQIL